MKTIHAADLFCGAGGTSTGLAKAAAKRRFAVDLIAVNHWRKAVATHEYNHPWARHLCADLASVEADPNRLVTGGHLHLLVASPECTHHSIARGGKPCSDQSRASAWHVLHWCERLTVDEILVENVREFKDWGPLLTAPLNWKGKTVASGRPDPRKKGSTFRAFVDALTSFGYTVETRIINAADYGAATTRKRLFLRASLRSRKIIWPEPTHAKTPAAGQARWKPSREIIDWSVPSQSIHARKKPLKPKTLARIEAGLKKFGGEAFIAVLRGTSPDQTGAWSLSLDEPLGTISAGGVHAALCQPFIVPMEHKGRGALRGSDEPLPTITTAKGGAFGLCQPFLVQYQGGEAKKSNRVHSVDEPLPTQPTENRFALCQPFVLNVAHSKGDRVSSCDEPLGTIPAGHRGEYALCQPFLTKYYGTGGAVSVDEPLDTVTARDRFALVQPMRRDILFRMLKPHELAAAMGFENYLFAGTTTDQVRQIGNAVAVPPAEALCGSILDTL